MNPTCKLLKLRLLILLLVFSSITAKSQYNTLWIPDTLSGTNFNLTIRDTFRQVLPGQQTIVGAINRLRTWGPTLFWNKGDSVQMNVTNAMLDTTTIHWHGIHLPAIMDGGPYQTIPPNTTWNPSFRVKNQAAMYWYHPHLHMMTQEQLAMGIGGLIIVRDPAETALVLPRKYGIDDIPLVLTDSRFDASNQIVISAYGDTMMANFTLNAQYNIPAQVVRMRLLNTASERFYNLGFSDNRTFYLIGSDGGLLSAPVSLTRKLLAPGERIEILVNCSGQVGTNFNLMVFNSALANDYPGWQPTNYSNSQFRNDLGRRDFNVVRFNVTAQTSSPITTIPATLVANVFPDSTQSVVTRSLTMINGGSLCPPSTPGCYLLDSTSFNYNRVDFRPSINTTEIWELKNTSNLAHPFHIHDAQFKILTNNGTTPASADRGWKDVVVVRKNQTVRFVVKFTDYADSNHPFMYHCHMAPHEDEGMMGQFTVLPECAPKITSVLPNPLGIGALASIKGKNFSGTSAVKFNNISSSFTILNDSLLSATVPVGTSIGKVTVTNSCGTNATLTNFTITNIANLTVKFFLQGLYVQPDSMRSVIPGFADSITVRLYAENNKATPVYNFNTVLRTNGNTLCNVPAAAIGRKYWICIRQRNSIEIWSKTTVTITNGLLHNFTSQ